MILASSVVVCSRNRPAMLEETLASLLEGEALPSDVVVIDQSDQPHPRLRSGEPRPGCRVTYRWTANRGASRARNEGIAQASEDVVVLLDDDVFVDARWLGIMVERLRTLGPRVVLTGRVAAAERTGSFVPSTADDPRPAEFAGRISTDVLSSGNMALYRSAMAEVGPFDERLGPGTAFPAAEDNDLGFRLLEADYRIVYVPDAVIYHRAWRAAREYPRLRWNYGLGQGAYYAKHLSLRDRHMLRRMVAGIGRRLKRALFRARREPVGACGDLTYVAGMLIGASQWLLTAPKTA